MNVTAILTRFRHHSPNGGYKRLVHELAQLEDISIMEFGNDETREDFPNSTIEKIQLRYKWIAEFRAWHYAQSIPTDVIHLMYGEEYFRFSSRLFPKTPIVATFHQPADVLDQEMKHGNLGGRVSAIAHRLNPNRFRSLSAAIVTNPDQKQVLKCVMPEDKIYHIPLGVDVKLRNFTASERKGGIVTLGNWFRDWSVYIDVVQKMPDQVFHLVNRQLPTEIKKAVQGLPNCHYHFNISDESLNEILTNSICAFLPLHKLAGSNALLECWASGLPIIMSNVNSDFWKKSGAGCLALFEPTSVDQAVTKLRDIISTTTPEIRKKCVSAANSFSWKASAEATFDLYNELK